jgi:exodeoxyribonuclease III
VNFRLLTYNIWKGGAGRVAEIAAVIEACCPDVALLQEATRPEVVAALAERTGMGVWRAFARQSLAYLSRGPVAHDQWHRPRFSRHAFIEVVPATVPVRLFGVHLSAVHAAWTERRRVLELGSLLRTIARHQHGFHLLAGDFNTLAPGAVLELRRLPPRLRPFVWLSGGRIKWRTIQTVIDAGFCDAFRILHPDEPGMTMPSWDAHVRLDYVFVPQAFRERLVSCEVITGGEVMRASDHLPVVADFDLP